MESLSGEAARTAHFLPHEEYSRQIARYWNVKASGAGFVTKFAVSSDYPKGFDVHVVGGFQHAEYSIPAEQLDEFNQNILGIMDVVAEFTAREILKGMIPAECTLTDWPTERYFSSTKKASKQQSSLSGKRLMDFEGTATFEKTFRNPEQKISARSSNIIEEFL